MGARSAEIINEISQRLNIALMPQNKAVIEGNKQAYIVDITKDNPDYQAILLEIIGRT